MTDMFEDRLRDAARATSTPEPPADLIERVVARRAAGDRIILPVDAPASRVARWRPIGLAFAAVAAALVVMLSPRTLHRATRATSGTSATAADSITSAGELFVSAAYAAQVARGPVFPPVRTLSGTRIRPGRYTYRIDYVDSAGRASPDGVGTIIVAPPDARGLLHVEHIGNTTIDGQRRTEAETLSVASTDLRLVSRVVHVRPYRRFSVINVTQRFAGDSVTGDMTTDGGIHRAFADELPRAYGPYLSDALAPLALVGVPLSHDWRGSLSAIGWGVVPSDVFLPVSLRVIGEERITTPIGAFDCWKLAADAGPQHRIEWVRKSDGLALRSDDERVTAQGRRRFVITHIE